MPVSCVAYVVTSNENVLTGSNENTRAGLAGPGAGAWLTIKWVWRDRLGTLRGAAYRARDLEVRSLARQHGYLSTYFVRSMRADLYRNTSVHCYTRRADVVEITGGEEEWDHVILQSKYIWVVKFDMFRCPTGCKEFRNEWDKVTRSISGLHWASVSLDIKKNQKMAWDYAYVVYNFTKGCALKSSGPDLGNLMM